MLNIVRQEGVGSPYLIAGTGYAGERAAASAGGEAQPDGVGATDSAAYPRYFSPVFDYSQAARQLIMVFRDRDTGETINQIPSETVLKSYEEALRRRGGRADQDGRDRSEPATTRTESSGAETNGAETTGADEWSDEGAAPVDVAPMPEPVPQPVDFMV